MTVLAFDVALFAITIVLVALYGLVVSGHFPSEYRGRKLQTRIGTVIIWATLVVASVAGIFALIVAIRVLPWPAIIISSGAMLLAAPLLLRPFPDRFVNGLLALIGFASAAILAAVGLWAIQ